MKQRNSFFARVAAVVATLALALGITVPALAATQGTLTIKGAEDGATSTVYKVADAVYSGADFQGYAWNANAASFAKTYESGKYADITAFEALADDSAEAVAFYDALTAGVRAGSVTLDKADTVNGNGTATLDAGTYLIVTTGSTGYVYKSASVTIDATAQNADVTKELKRTPVELKKDFANGDKQILGLQVGDSVSFNLDATVPQYPSNATSKYFQVSDTLSKGLTFNNDVKVLGTKDGKAYAELPASAYELVTNGATRPDGKTAVTFAVKFKNGEVKGYTGVRVQYSATLNSDATVSPVDGNPNAATLDYNNDPYDENHWQPKDDKEKVYSFGVHVVKTDAATGKALANVGFELYRGEKAGGDAIKFVVKDGAYVVATAADAQDQTLTTTVKTDANGELNVKGLGTGKYTLKETEPAAGYESNKGKTFAVELVDANNDGKLDSNVDTNIAELGVKNVSGFQLPVTGGIGTAIFTGVGVVLMGGGLAMVLRRRNAER